MSFPGLSCSSGGPESVLIPWLKKSRGKWRDEFVSQVKMQTCLSRPQRMLAHYSHVRIEAKRKALDGLAVRVKKVSYDTSDDTKPVETAILSLQVGEKNGGEDGTRTRGLCRDRRSFCQLYRASSYRVARQPCGRLALSELGVKVSLHPA